MPFRSPLDSTTHFDAPILGMTIARRAFERIARTPKQACRAEVSQESNDPCAWGAVLRRGLGGDGSHGRTPPPFPLPPECPRPPGRPGPPPPGRARGGLGAKASPSAPPQRGLASGPWPAPRTPLHTGGMGGDEVVARIPWFGAERGRGARGARSFASLTPVHCTRNASSLEMPALQIKMLLAASGGGGARGSSSPAQAAAGVGCCCPAVRWQPTSLFARAATLLASRRGLLGPNEICSTWSSKACGGLCRICAYGIRAGTRVSLRRGCTGFGSDMLATKSTCCAMHMSKVFKRERERERMSNGISRCIWIDQWIS